jgi:hypothetical protein
VKVHVSADRARQALVALVAAQSQERNRLFDEAVKELNGNDVLHASLNLYRTTLCEDYLILAASLLYHMGTKAWPSLDIMSASNTPECEYFVSVVTRVKGISDEQRISALSKLAENDSIGVRQRILEQLPRVSGESRRRLLSILSTDPDEEIRDVALDYLSDYE